MCIDIGAGRNGEKDAVVGRITKPREAISYRLALAIEGTRVHNSAFGPSNYAADPGGSNRAGVERKGRTGKQVSRDRITNWLRRPSGRLARGTRQRGCERDQP